MPLMAFGAGTPWYEGRLGVEPLRDAVVAALNAGFRHIDDAEMYKNEEATGAGIRKWLEASRASRNELFVTSKVLQSIQSVGIEAACRRSLAVMGLDYFDLYLIHAPVHTDGSALELPLEKLWAQMEELVEKGLVRSIGVSNFRVVDLKVILASCKIKPCVNQLERHPRLLQPRLASFCTENGIGLSAFGSLLPLTSDDAASSSILPALQAQSLAAEGVNVAQLLLAWNLQRGVACVTTTTKPERLAQLLGAQKLRLSEELLEKLDALGAKDTKRTFWSRVPLDWEAE